MHSCIATVFAERQASCVPADDRTMTELKMREMPSSTEYTRQPLTPRQDRIEAAIIDALRAGGTRSELREHVCQLADLLRIQGVSADGAFTVIRSLGQRATPWMNTRGKPAVGDSPTDRITMMVRWMAARYSRAD